MDAGVSTNNIYYLVEKQNIWAQLFKASLA